MHDKVERVLAQGEVIFRMNCDQLMGLVSPEQATNTEFMKTWLINNVASMIEQARAE